MSPKQESLIWIAQRGSAMVLIIGLIVHLGAIIAAVQGGISAAEISGRMNGHTGWFVFYLCFLVAVSIHAPIGLRSILIEVTSLPNRSVGLISLLLAVMILAPGLRAIFGLYGVEW